MDCAKDGTSYTFVKCDKDRQHFCVNRRVRVKVKVKVRVRLKVRPTPAPKPKP